MPIVAALPAAAVAVVEDVVAAAAGVAVELVVELELLELPHAASASAQAAIATIPAARNLAVLRVDILLPRLKFSETRRYGGLFVKTPTGGKSFLAARRGRCRDAPSEHVRLSSGGRHLARCGRGDPSRNCGERAGQDTQERTA